MKKVIGFLIAGLILVAGNSQIWADTCSCSAPDGSCGASIVCSGGCIATCGTGGDCQAKCSGGGGTPDGPLQRPVFLAPDPSGTDGASSGDQATQASLESLVSLDLRSASSQAVGELLSAATGVQVAFVNSGPEDLLSLEAINFPFGELVIWLRRHGSVVVLDQRSARGLQTAVVPRVGLENLLRLHVASLAPAELATLLAQVLRTEVDFTPFDPDVRVSLDAKNMPVGEAFAFLGRFGSLEVPELEIRTGVDFAIGSR